jgi:hypothetical protein
LIIIPAPVPVGRRGFTFPSLVRLFLEDSVPVYSYENPCLFISQFACPNNVRLYTGQIGQLIPMDEETAEQFRQLAKKMMEQAGSAQDEEGS